jgi:TfoX/Sxy family transcriptional regulator of competence genes
MAYSEELAERIREVIGERENVVEKKMFGGVAWMVAGNMAVGAMEDRLMVRLEPEEAEAALGEHNVGPMDFTGKAMRGFVTVEPGGLEEDSDLERWINAGADFAASLPPK